MHSRCRLGWLCALLSLVSLAHTALAEPKAAGPRTPRKPSTTTNAARANKPASVGEGIIEVAVDRSGRVTSARMFKSTGNKTFDRASMTAMLRARFKPGTAPLVRIPISWTLTRGSR